MPGQAALARAPEPHTPLSLRLRAETRPDHDRVDAAFGGFGLSDREGYTRFLLAQARVLPDLEAMLRPAELVPGWRGRSGALLADLASLGQEAPPSIAVPIPGGAAGRWGALYVLEGSRLGGAVLVKRVPPGVPTAFLASTHPQGAWRDLLARLDAASDGPAWELDAIRGAQATFAAFEQAARLTARFPA